MILTTFHFEPYSSLYYECIKHVPRYQKFMSFTNPFTLSVNNETNTIGLLNNDNRKEVHFLNFPSQDIQTCMKVIKSENKWKIQEFFKNTINPKFKEHNKVFFQTCLDDFSEEDQNTLLEQNQIISSIEKDITILCKFFKTSILVRINFESHSEHSKIEIYKNQSLWTEKINSIEKFFQEKYREHPYRCYIRPKQENSERLSLKQNSILEKGTIHLKDENIPISNHDIIKLKKEIKNFGIDLNF